MRNLLLFVAMSMCFSVFMPANGQVIVGDAAPDFSYSDTDGNTFKLSDHRGEVVFMYLFGNSCPSCLGVGNRTETEIHQVFSSNPKFTAVGLDMWDNSSSVASVNSFKSQTGITHPLLIKAGGVAASYSSSYDRIIIVDKNGIIRHKNNSLVSNDIDNAKLVIEEFLLTSSTEGEIPENHLRKINAYPNPVRENLKLVFNLKNDHKVQVNIFNSIGSKIVSKDTESFLKGENTYSIDVSGLSNGIYFYRFDFQGEPSLTGKFLVKK